MKTVGIVCTNFNRAIGKNNQLLFNIKKDMQIFKKLTQRTNDPAKINAVLMGSNTFYSIPENFRPLPKRANLVVSNKNYADINKRLLSCNNSKVFSDIKSSLEYASQSRNIENLFVIGGSSIYEYFMTHDLFDKLYETEILNPRLNIGDVFFPEINDSLKKVESKPYYAFNVHCNATNKCIPSLTFKLNTYKNIKKSEYDFISQENNYLNTLKDVLENGEVRQTRNSKTISKFGVRMEFDISEYFPLLTTKKVYWKGIVEELLWFINAQTDSKLLEDKKVNIWKKNSEKKYLDSIGLNHYKDGWCGPIYGFQWRHFNAIYTSPDGDYSGHGVDQLANVIDLIKNDPKSRRIFMTAWNPCQLDQMALPPCHVSYQFYVTENGYIDCQMYQRSGDLFLGVPFNIASTGLLTSIIAKTTGYKPGRVIINIGDAHIYQNHVEQIHEQLTRTPYKLPKLMIKNTYTDIEAYSADDFILENYCYHPKIKADMLA